VQRGRAVDRREVQPAVLPDGGDLGGRCAVRAERADIGTLAALDLELPLHQSRSPVFSAGQKETLEEATGAWEESIDDPGIAAVVASTLTVIFGSVMRTRFR
jgi:hypothetical protein